MDHACALTQFQQQQQTGAAAVREGRRERKKISEVDLEGGLESQSQEQKLQRTAFHLR